MIKKILYFVILALLSAGLLAASFVLKKQKDTTIPAITLPAGKLSYTEGDPDTELLAGVSAWDDKDGDLSKDVFVYEIVPIQATGMAKVVYAVSDSSKNVATADLMVKYSRKKETIRMGLGGEPVLRLSANGTTISKGDIFDPHDFVNSVYDDTDSREELLNRLVVKGSYGQNS